MLIEEEEDFKKLFRVVFSDFPGNDNGGCENITASMALGSHAGKKKPFKSFSIPGRKEHKRAPANTCFTWQIVKNQAGFYSIITL